MLLHGILVVCFTIGQILGQENPEAETKYGRVQGTRLELHDGSVVNSFLGVPFARPPVDELRFAPPEEPEPWEETLVANELKSVCMQSIVGLLWLTHPAWTDFDEDCLNLNIAAPADQDNGPYPVMVFLHGGAYQSGANIQYPGHFLAAKDVVVVVPNYRLGIMGFAYTADDVVPGNAGMMDQILALQFVQENIANFGGDPFRVTIFGESAGAGSVGLMLMSPLATDLFHGAILQSGCENALWAYNEPEQNPENYVVDVAKQLNCDSDSSQEMIDCLRDIRPRRLIDQEFNCTEGYICLGAAPVVDGNFLPDEPFSLRDRGEYNKVPEMIGINRDEATIGLLGLFDGILMNGVNRTDFEETIVALADAVSINFPQEDRADVVAQAGIFLYTDWANVEDPFANREQLGEAGTDGGFGFVADAQAKRHSGDGLDTYFYVFKYLSKNATIVPDWVGTPHALELPMVFGWPLLPLNENVRNDTDMWFDPIRFTEEDVEYTDYIMTLWTNFAKYGNPTPDPLIPPNKDEPLDWPTFQPLDTNYMYIDFDMYVGKNYRQTEFAFWNKYVPYLAAGTDFSLTDLGLPSMSKRQQYNEFITSLVEDVLDTTN